MAVETSAVATTQEQTTASTSATSTVAPVTTTKATTTTATSEFHAELLFFFHFVTCTLGLATTTKKKLGDSTLNGSPKLFSSSVFFAVVAICLLAFAL